MLDELKSLIRDVIKGVRERFEPLEADVAEVKKDVAEVKAFMAEIKGGGLDDLKAEVDAFGIKAPAPAPQPTAGDHPDPDMAAAGLPAAGPLPTEA